MKSKENYKFMWGQKQSAMITEAMLSQLLFDIDYNGKVINSGIDEDLFILVNGVFEHYMPDKSIKRLEENGKRYFNKKFTKILFRKINNHINDFFKFCDKIKNQNFKLLTNDRLRRFFIQYYKYIKNTFIYFETSTPSGTTLLAKKIKDILEMKFKDQNLVDNYFIVLSSPDHLDETMKERLTFLKLVGKNKISKFELENYARSYPALFFNTYSKKEVLNFLKNKLKCEHGKKLLPENKKIKKNLLEIRKKHQEIYAQTDENLKLYATILQRAALDRYRLKHVWSGGEYLCLDLLKEISRRINIKFDDFIKSYMFTDVFNFLDTNKKLNKEEIKARKECILIHYFNKELHYYYGKEGITRKCKLLKNKKQRQQNLKEIKGTVANRGFIRGVARIVNVKDLNQFIQDSKVFKRGEILVTTMTSPLMVSLIEKAGGIITDEGGITSHAAVVSREFKIPCIVGTHEASFIIKTGSVIELDANNGVIKILKRCQNFL